MLRTSEPLHGLFVRIVNGWPWPPLSNDLRAKLYHKRLTAHLGACTLLEVNDHIRRIGRGRHIRDRLLATGRVQ